MKCVPQKFATVRPLQPCAVLLVAACLWVLVPRALSQGSSAALPWSGQATCQLNLQQDGYTHQETQTWTITAAAPRTDSGNMPVYNATWSSSGAGSAQKARGMQTIAGGWTSAGGPLDSAIAIFIRASDRRLLIKSRHAQLRAVGGIAGLQQVMTPGAQPTQTAMKLDLYEWPFPSIGAAGDSTDVAGTGTVTVSGGLLPMQSPSMNATAACQWHFARGAVVTVQTQDTQTPTSLTSAVPIPAVPGSTVPLPGAGAAGPAMPKKDGSPAGSSGGTQAGTVLNGSNKTESCAVEGGTGTPPAMNPPTASAGVASVTLSWTNPAGASGIDSYVVEFKRGRFGPALQRTVQAPATSLALDLSACYYPTANCSAPRLYAFRIRAHNTAGCGAYSTYTSSVRPLVSYFADNVAGVWSATGCLKCHTGPNTKLDLSGTVEQSYSRVGPFVAQSQANRDRLLACPAGGSCSNSQGVSHPGGQGFATTSKEYLLLLQWIQDGFKN